MLAVPRLNVTLWDSVNSWIYLTTLIYKSSHLIAAAKSLMHLMQGSSEVFLVYAC